MTYGYFRAQKKKRLIVTYICGVSHHDYISVSHSQLVRGRGGQSGLGNHGLGRGWRHSWLGYGRGGRGLSRIRKLNQVAVDIDDYIEIYTTFFRAVYAGLAKSHAQPF